MDKERKLKEIEEKLSYAEPSEVGGLLKEVFRLIGKGKL